MLHSLQLPSDDVEGFGTANIATIAFDPFEELLWVGDCHGRVTSFAGAQLERYVSIRAHEEDEGPILQFLFSERSLVSLAARSVHSMIRRGLTQWSCEHSSMTRLSCMVSIDKGAALLVAGYQPVMLKIDAVNGHVLDQIVAPSEYTMMKSGRYICAATSTGSVDFLDPSTLAFVKSWQAHTASISDMAVSNNSLVSCGRATRPHGPAMLESLAKVYDFKTMQQMAPIPFPVGAAYVNVHPKLSTTCILGASNGQLQVIDLVNHNTSNIIMLGNFITHFIVSGSGNIWAIADQNNAIHLWGSPSKIMSFNDNVRLPKYAEEEEQLPQIGIDEDVPFSKIGMPFYRERLLSAWGNEFPWEVGYLPPEVDLDVERNLRAGGLGQWAPNTTRAHKDRVHRKRISNTVPANLFVPNFISEKARIIENGGTDKSIGEAAENLANLSFSSATRPQVPGYYVNVKIKYGKFGIGDFDFRAYNTTRYSGLETDISNSYLNSLLQVFRYTPVIRNHSLHHVSGRCLDENCLFCELGFLIDMLEKAGGEVCQATNFLKLFSNHPSAGRRNILEDENPQGSLAKRLADAYTFLLTAMTQDSRRMDPPEFQVDRVLTLGAQMTMRCSNCHSQTYNPAPSLTVDLAYLPYSPPGKYRSPSNRFTDILSQSFSSRTSNRGWCPSCRRHPSQIHRRTFIELPPILSIDAALERGAGGAKNNAQYWAQPGWLPDEIGVAINRDGDIMCYEGERLEQLRHNSSVLVYDLVGLVAEINSTQGSKPHLVSFVNVSISDRHVPDGVEVNDWHLFNDFLVRKIDREEALRFDTSWKTPVALTYQMKAFRQNIDDSWKSNPDITCLYHNGSLNHALDALGFPLQPESEIPQPGFILGVDAEFVSLEREEIEIKIDGAKEVIRPKRHGTGRISALRGSGEHEGVPFIDDYIKINETIVDHLTQFSGLFAGDLDPRRSTHALQSLKVAYKKLWLLLNLGCTFVGHGVDSDFRTINIHVPKAQIVDTVTLFRPSNEKRRLSLRFLAWYFLDEEIQTGNHDSIVDARTALQLWRKYQDFVQRGVLEQKLMEIYRDGPNTAFKPPAEFEAQGGKIGRGKKKREGVDSSLLGGRMTPDQGGSAVSSAIGTPNTVGGRRREGEGYFGSPLK